jgi:hypothetical protein
MNAGTGAVLFQFYPGICLTTEEKHEEHTQGSQLVTDTSRCFDFDCVRF